ncbi:hypothetical protein AN958_08326 [Leucoagaricus sp. SymC.cos]|nr:hypothetical protein AN958_08326 [Leucoagaricus sp. SymC.cos]
MSTPTLPSKPKKILVGLREDRERSRQLDVHRAAIFVLTQKDRPIPSAFPLTLEEFHAKPRDIQIRVANFLNADSARKDRMMTEFNWAWRQVEGLVREFSSNVSFFIP